MLRVVVLIQLPAHSGVVRILPPTGNSLLGRSAVCDIVLDHPSVSRRHALVCVEEETVRVSDLTSKNGTFVGDVRVAGNAVATPGTLLRFGGLAFLTATHEYAVEEPNSSLDTDQGARAEGPERLSEAQGRVFRLLVQGLPEKRIAARLGISPCTVHNHVAAIYRAFGVHSRAEFMVRALSGEVYS